MAYIQFNVCVCVCVCRKMYNWWRQRKHKRQTKDEQHLHMAWEEDYHMQDPGRLSLFDEYLEMGMFSIKC